MKIQKNLEKEHFDVKFSICAWNYILSGFSCAFHAQMEKVGGLGYINNLPDTSSKKGPSPQNTYNGFQHYIRQYFVKQVFLYWIVFKHAHIVHNSCEVEIFLPNFKIV